MSKRNVKKRGVQKGTKRQLGWQPWAFGAILLLVLGAAIWFLKPVLWPPDMAVADSELGQNIINVQADMAGIYPKEIRVKAGEPVTIRLRSLDNQFHTDGGGKHGFAIDELDVDIVAQPLSTASATFTPTMTGEYEFYCDICCGGRANPSMQGKLIVEL